MYLAQDDVQGVLDLLNDDPEIAFVVSNGPGEWVAKSEVVTLSLSRTGLWHVPSGPLPLLRPKPDTHTDPLSDPWSGWIERLQGADPSTPYFGPGHPGIFWLNLHPEGWEEGSFCGLSSFEWIGNHYTALGSRAAPETERWWRRLRQRIAKRTRRVPRKSLSSGEVPEIFAFDAAYCRLEAGGIADMNPSPHRRPASRPA
jgi:hypothetical protein